jgi:5-methylcytosine-specific restriction endonuclease McrA
VASKSVTPRSRVKNALRKLWLQSRERATALKREAYTCERCGIKQSTAKGREVKVQVHHRVGIDWEGLVDTIIERVLQTPDDLEVLCKTCHDKEHHG